LEKAMAYYQTALKIDKGGERWGEGMDLCHLGRANYDLGNMEEALKYHEEALSIAIEVSVAEDQYEALLGLGMIHHSQGNLREAGRKFEEALKLEIPKTHYSCNPRLGIVRLEEGNAGEAHEHLARGIKQCEGLLERTPDLYDARYHLALTELASGQNDKALATYRRAIETCPAKGVLMNSLRDVRLLRRMPVLSPGVPDAEALLAEASR
jgi:tetratricopeptide (TPR) repeat protein